MATTTTRSLSGETPAPAPDPGTGPAFAIASRDLRMQWKGYVRINVRKGELFSVSDGRGFTDEFAGRPDDLILIDRTTYQELQAVVGKRQAEVNAEAAARRQAAQEAKEAERARIAARKALEALALEGVKDA